jgi:hypothetical protein
MMLDKEHGLLRGQNKVATHPALMAALALACRLAAAAVASGATDLLLMSPAALERRLREDSGAAESQPWMDHRRAGGDDDEDDEGESVMAYISEVRGRGPGGAAAARRLSVGLASGHKVRFPKPEVGDLVHMGRGA